MAKGKKPEMPEAGVQLVEQPQQNFSDDWERRRDKLGEELIRRGVKKTSASEEKPSQAANGMGYAIKLSSEFLGAIIVGVVLGLGFDQLVGISPWGLIVFLFLGFAAGIMNVLRSVGRIAPSEIDKRNANDKNDND